MPSRDTSNHAFVLALLLSLLLAGPVLPDTPVGGDVSGTWNLAGSPYIVNSNVTVPSGQMLTIHSGVEVKFSSATQMLVNGDLLVAGSPSQNVVFTSNQLTPAPGDWVGILVNGAGARAFLGGCWVRYAGRNNNVAVAATNADSLTWDGGGPQFCQWTGISITNTNFYMRRLFVENNGGDGVIVNNPALPPTTWPTLYTDRNTFTNNSGRALSILANPGSLPAQFYMSGNGTNGVYATGTLGGAEPAQKWVWCSQDTVPIIVDNVTVNDDSLEVCEGSVVKFWSFGSTLTCNAAAVLSTPGPGDVWFTSLKDDAVGGDTNGDGNATAPAPGDWTYVLLQNLSAADLHNTWFAYGGRNNNTMVATTSGNMTSLAWDGGGASNALLVGVGLNLSTAPDLRNLTVSDNGGDGLLLNADVPPVLDNITASGNGGRAIVLNENPGHIPPSLSGSGNGTNGVYVTGTLGGGEPTQKWTWGANPGFPVVVANLSVSDDTLEVAPGAVVKFWALGSTLTCNAGSVLSTPGPGDVWFTSLKDDSVGGDTNGDGSATTPAPGDWTFIALQNLSEATLNNTFVAYGGRNNNTMVATTSGNMTSLSWDGGGARDAFLVGVGLNLSSAPDLRNLTVSDNGGDGLLLNAEVPPVLDNITASGNGGRAIVLNENPGHIPPSLSGSGNGTNGVYVTGTLGGGEPAQKWTWGANPGFPVVVANLAVSDDTLEVAPGAVVKFWALGSTLTCNAAAVLSTPGPGDVWFTSLKDDAVGGDTNGDGSATAPAQGDWTYVLLQSLSAADLHNTWFAYGGRNNNTMVATTSGNMTSLSWDGGGAQSALLVGVGLNLSTAPDLRNLTVSDNGGDGLLLNADVPPVLDNITASGNGGRAIVLNENPGHIPPSLSGSGNGTNGVYVTGTLGGSEPAQKWTWGANPGFPVVVANLSVSDDTLEVAPGAVVKFWTLGSTLVCNASSVLSTPGPGAVWFTSIKDDAVGGDTNGDGSATAPAPGDWTFIALQNQSEATLSNTFVSFGGRNNNTMVTTNSGRMFDLNWNGGGVLHTQWDGMRITAENATVSGVRFDDIGNDAVNVNANVAADFHFCDFVDVAGDGLNNNFTSVLVDATQCYWGHPTGPYDPTNGNPDYNPGGLGAPVSDVVEYRPFAAGEQTNGPPGAFTLLAPVANDTIPAVADSLEFCWSRAIDPDGDAVTYELEINWQANFNAQMEIFSTTLTDTCITLPRDSVGEGSQYWRVTARDSIGATTVPAPSQFFLVIAPPTGIGDGSRPPAIFSVGHAFPNPFSERSRFDVANPGEGDITIRVYDVAGRLVRMLTDRRYAAGVHSFEWNGRDRSGRRVASGVYFFRVKTGSGTQTRRFVLVR